MPIQQYSPSGEPLRKQNQAAVIVRPYEAQDRDAVWRIAADTAFFGEPAEIFLDDRRVFIDAFCRYYTEVEPESAWVAEAGGRPVGHLFGCLDTRTQQSAWPREHLRPVLLRALRGGYRLGGKTWSYALAYARASLSGEGAPVDLDAYPAHLHINLEEGYRGQGIGRRLLAVYLERLRLLGVPGVHLRTTSMNKIALRLYERMGFLLLDARPSRSWSRLIPEPVENRLYGLKLADAL